MKARYLLKIAYDGMKYNGWQAQQNAMTVQEEVERCLSRLLKEEIKIVGAGRTDTGVHALGQFAHFDAQAPLPKDPLRRMNGILPSSIAVLAIYRVPPHFHARFDALYRKYVYRISLRKDPFEKERSLFVPYPLDIEPMQIAANALLDFHHFGAFCKAHGSNKTYTCKIQQAEWKRNEHILAFHIQADRFLRGMVRAIVGTLLEVGKKKLSVSDFVEIIQSQDRKNAKQNVAPYGLYLTEVGYPQEILCDVQHEMAL